MPVESFREWEERLVGLATGIRLRTRGALLEALARGAADELARTVGQGAGDVTFGLDRPAEDFLDDWLRERGREGPLSLLTEDRGWRHLGPAPDGGTAPLEGFDHGGPRIAVDPIDGTRNLMADLRSAWTVVSFAPPGADEPTLVEVEGGLVAEIPPSNAARARLFYGHGEVCELEERTLGDDVLDRRRVHVDGDDRVDNGYFPFFRYKPEFRPAIAALEAAFFARLERFEEADVRSCYDDQYISNAGQLVQLLSGTYRLIVDARALLARNAGNVPTVTSKPYDVAGAIVCARAAGAVVTAADGGTLAFPLDARTPVDFVGYANEATRKRLEPHWLAVLAEAAGRSG